MAEMKLSNHQSGCTNPDRLEHFLATRARRDNAGNVFGTEQIGIIRCVQCGATETADVATITAARSSAEKAGGK